MNTMTIKEYETQLNSTEKISLPLLHLRAASQAERCGCMIDGFGMIGTMEQVKKFMDMQNPTNLKRYQYRLWMLNEIPVHGARTFDEMGKHAAEYRKAELGTQTFKGMLKHACDAKLKNIHER